jgi:hypothetical protein
VFFLNTYKQLGRFASRVGKLGKTRDSKEEIRIGE